MMRTTVLLLIIAGGIWWGYSRWVSGDVQDTAPTNTTDVSAGVQQPVSPQQNTPPTPIAGSPERNEINSLRKQLSADPDDGTRIQLASALLATGEVEDRGEALGILGSIEKSSSELSATARVLLLREADEPQRSRYAQKIHELGKNSPGYGESCFIIAEQIGFEDDASAVQCWKLLSEAYNSSDENSWRQPIRMRLRDLVDHWVLSRRPFSMCSVATVVTGDSLHVIAKQNKISVDSLRLLNNVRGNTIHPGQNLKFLGGQIHAEVDKSDYWIDVFIDGNWLLGYPIGHGKENCTPTGEFTVNILQKNPMWQPRDGRPPIEYGKEGNPLGDRWIGFKDGTHHFGLGIHGTAEPESIGSQASEGCIRLRNQDVVQIYPWFHRGTRVIVRN